MASSTSWSMVWILGSGRAVELLHGVAELGEEARGIAVGAERDFGVRFKRGLVEGVGGTHLCGVEVELGLGGFGDTGLMEVVDDADDFELAVFVAEGEGRDVLAGAWAAALVEAGKGLVDDRDRLRGGGVGCIEVAAAKHAEAENML